MVLQLPNIFYYPFRWSLSPRCHEQVRCNGEGEKLLRSGGVKNKNVVSANKFFKVSLKLDFSISI